jgi:hypothetical protein
LLDLGNILPRLDDIVELVLLELLGLLGLRHGANIGQAPGVELAWLSERRVAAKILDHFRKSYQKAWRAGSQLIVPHMLGQAPPARASKLPWSVTATKVQHHIIVGIIVRNVQ